MAYTAPQYYSSSKDPRYPSTKAATNVVSPPSSYGGSSSLLPASYMSIDTYSSVYKTSPHYSVGHPGTTSAYPAYSTASTPRSQASSQHYQQSPSAYYPSSHSPSKSYDSNDTSGYASSRSSASSATVALSSSSAMYPASPKRLHSCDQCALSFDRSHDLKRHRDSHSGAKPFECPSCSRTFTRKDALKRHQSQKQCGIEDA